MSQLAVLALAAGGAIALQASMNAQLGVLLKSAMLATSVAFLCSCLFTVAALLTATKQYPQWHEVRAVPIYLWFSGGALSAFGVAMFYYLIPKMGVGSMMSYALSGQIIIAVLASHFGWFDLPVKPLSLVKLIGAVTLIFGVFLLNLEPSNGH
ncbi:DMT family transporter [Motilimonas eburnea]|uniref:DMT family transporter n=1 Tax=Motilimonas eburnea TaxID=1737488 RepID=UPI001E4F855D|nr:DMT family transporter [Motilimonas eburnea]MCE2572973.1 DMT family transporter [Motilimonas eburnea]